MLDTLSKSMPRFEEYSKLFPTHDRLHLRLIDIYETSVIFFVRAFRFFKSKRISLFIIVTWKSLDQVFKDTVQRTGQLRDELENEAKAANINMGFIRETEAQRRHQDIIAILPTALAAPRLLNNTIVVPYSRNDAFFAREKELSCLHSYLTGSQLPNAKHLRVMSILGIGGMGKTQLALEYVYKHRKSYKAIFWLRAENVTVLQQDYAQIGRLLDTKNELGMDLGKCVKAAKDWLSITDEPWLLVFDNVEDIADLLQKYWPNSGRGAIVVTTRDRDNANRLGRHTINLEGFSSDEGALLLSSMDPHIPLNVHTSEIVKELGGLPLAICQMGCYIQQTECSLDQFLNLLRDRPHRLYSDESSTATLPYSNTLAKCCDLSIGLLQPSDLHLLGVIAFFQTDEVQESLLLDGCSQIPRLRHLSDQFEWNDAIRILTKHGLVERLKHRLDRALRMHRIIKNHTLQTLKSKGGNLWLDAFYDATHLLDAVFPSRPPDGGTMCKQWKECEIWLPHVISVKGAYAMARASAESIPRHYLETLCNCSWYMWERGIDQALEFASESLRICDEILGHDQPHILRADTLTVLGALKMTDIRTRKECEFCFRKALEVREKCLSAQKQPTHNDRLQLANAFNNTGVSRLVLEEYDRALPLFQKALDIKYQLGDENSMPYDIGLSYYNICRVQMGQGLTRDALTNAKKAFELVEGSNGPDDFRTNQFRFTYADLLVESGEIEQGLRMHELTLEIRKRVMGVTNNDSGVSYYGLSCVYQKLGRLEDALIYIENAITIFTHIPGADDRCARSYFRKYLILAELNRKDLADAALTEANQLLAELSNAQEPRNTSLKTYDALVSYYNK
ncbi:hypothetical protein F4825DRAFT_424777 [Nemania diffusa]|nr:hypothetical protein F4825DRAFT_424777 [Nemania diffusa]